MGDSGSRVGVGGRQASQAEVPSCVLRSWPASPPPSSLQSWAGTPRGRIMCFHLSHGDFLGPAVREAWWAGTPSSPTENENYEAAVSGQKLVLLGAREQSFLDADVYAGVLGWPDLLRDISITARSCSYGRVPEKPWHKGRSSDSEVRHLVCAAIRPPGIWVLVRDQLRQCSKLLSKQTKNKHRVGAY